MNTDRGDKEAGKPIHFADAQNIAHATRRLRAGKLVAFPTETVYGLGANALDADAVRAIFTTKGRPATNPLIVHVPDVAAARRYAREWSAIADMLAMRFWPGPLTLVVRRAAAIPDIVTAGGDTVGLRVPNHSIALDLLRQSGVPIAAPSANRSEEVSPTTAQHVLDSLGAHTDDLWILDGGPCAVGLESTVLDITENPPRLLRPGAVTHAELCQVAGTLIALPMASDATKEVTARAPGQMRRHYAPQAQVIVAPFSALRGVLQLGDALLTRYPMTYEAQAQLSPNVHSFVLPEEPERYGRVLYSTLRALDDAGVRRIIIEEVPETDEWRAIRDRLHRASAPKSEPKPGETRYNHRNE